MIRALAVLASIVLLGTGGYVGYEYVEAPQSQIFGPTIVQGSPLVREVALSFDDGPNPPYTDRILRVLREEHVHATFFVVGRAAQRYPGIVRRIALDGNAIGNHTWDHPHLILQSRAAIKRELDRTDDVIARITGTRPNLMRPPFGVRDFVVIAEARRLGYQVVMWSVPLPNDWEQPGDVTIARRVLANVRDGSIIVLHDGNRGRFCGAASRYAPRVCDREQEIGATRDIIDALHRRGFRFVTVPQLVADARTRRAMGMHERMTDEEVRPFVGKPVRVTLADGRILAGTLHSEGDGHGHGHAHYVVESSPVEKGGAAVKEQIHGSAQITDVEDASNDPAART